MTKKILIDEDKLKLALEAFGKINSWKEGGWEKTQQAITALRQAIEQAQKQEPVAMRYDFDGYGWKYIDSGSGSDWQTRIKDAEPVFASPPQRQPLTYVDLRRVANQCGLGANEVSAQAQAKVDNFARAIEAAHGIKGEA